MAFSPWTVEMGVPLHAPPEFDLDLEIARALGADPYEMLRAVETEAQRAGPQSATDA